MTDRELLELRPADLSEPAVTERDELIEIIDATATNEEAPYWAANINTTEIADALLAARFTKTKE